MNNGLDICCNYWLHLVQLFNANAAAFGMMRFIRVRVWSSIGRTLESRMHFKLIKRDVQIKCIQHWGTIRLIKMMCASLRFCALVHITNSFFFAGAHSCHTIYHSHFTLWILCVSRRHSLVGFYWANEKNRIGLRRCFKSLCVYDTPGWMGKTVKNAQKINQVEMTITLSINMHLLCIYCRHSNLYAAILFRFSAIFCSRPFRGSFSLSLFRSLDTSRVLMNASVWVWVKQQSSFQVISFLDHFSFPYSSLWAQRDTFLHLPRCCCCAFICCPVCGQLRLTQHILVNINILLIVTSPPQHTHRIYAALCSNNKKLYMYKTFLQRRNEWAERRGGRSIKSQLV